jgi:hypothetical protein
MGVDIYIGLLLVAGERGNVNSNPPDRPGAEDGLAEMIVKLRHFDPE